MAQLIVRNLDDGVKSRLHARAERHGRSMEAEIRNILNEAAEAEAPAPAPLGTCIARRFVGLGLKDTLPELRGELARPAKFER